MTKRVEEQLNYFKYNGEPVRFRLGTLVTIGFFYFIDYYGNFYRIAIQAFLYSIRYIF